MLTTGLDEDTLNARYEQMVTDLHPSVHRYNAFWSSAESSAIPSSSSPIECPAGYVQIPQDSTGLKVNGGRYNSYRCLSAGQISQWQTLLNTDAEHGFQSAAVIWCAPPNYRNPLCLGMPEAGAQAAPNNISEAYRLFVTVQNTKSVQVQTIAESVLDPPIGSNETDVSDSDSAVAQSAIDSSGCSCAPMDIYLGDLADYITFLGYDLPNGPGRFSHYITWNEAANSIWCDFSPDIDTTKEITPEGMNMWITKYANLMRAIHDNAKPPALIYASTDRW